MRYRHVQGDKTEGDDENADRGMSTNQLTFPSLLDNNPEGVRQAGGWTCDRAIPSQRTDTYGLQSYLSLPWLLYSSRLLTEGTAYKSKS